MKTKEELQLLLHSKIDEYNLDTLVNLAIHCEAISLKEYIETISSIIFDKKEDEYTTTNCGYASHSFPSGHSTNGRKEDNLVVTSCRDFNKSPINAINSIIDGYNRLVKDDSKFPMIALINKGSKEELHNYELRVGW